MTLTEVEQLPTWNLIVVDGNTGEVLSENADIILPAEDDQPVEVHLVGNTEMQVIETFPAAMRQDADQPNVAYIDRW